MEKKYDHCDLLEATGYGRVGVVRFFLFVHFETHKLDLFDCIV